MREFFDENCHTFYHQLKQGNYHLKDFVYTKWKSTNKMVTYFNTLSNNLRYNWLREDDDDGENDVDDIFLSKTLQIFRPKN